MEDRGEDITNNGKDSNKYKEYKRHVYWCKQDDIWISIEIPKEGKI